MNDKELDERQLREKMKWELARELGIRLSQDGYGGKLTSRDCGKLGSILKKRAKIILQSKK